ncbi:aminodeoxychorismate synthase component I [Clostridium sp.]|uniref:aminodeoxychorismate synthase component I n=1 Tax=Clostridium sp. TaxID=1506 RepID=UPI003463F637
MKALVKEFNSSLDAFSIYTLFKDKDVIFLDSSLEDKNLSKYSFIGVNPFLKFKSYGEDIWVNHKKIKGDPFKELENIIKEYSIENKESHLPFIGGAIGYISYDMGRNLETLPSSAKEDIKIPESYFLLYDNIIIFDHLNNKSYVSSMGIFEDKEISIEKIINRISNGKEVIYNEVKSRDKEFKSNFTKDEYMEGVETFREYIRSGDIYIGNLTQRFSCTTDRDSYDIYKDLRKINPSPFGAYMELDDFHIISSSPERFMSIRDGQVETRPIKGTRPRGRNKEEDEKNRLELLNSEKDKSELLMIVDLERNDLSKVCKNHSVKVTELFVIEEYSTVFHLVSTIKGELKSNVSSVNCIKECFPGGSITGAPKIRTMEVIEEVEGLRRNIYTGAIGYFDFRGNADFNITIRTILKKEDKAYFGVGGGITFESIKEDEYEETLHKAKALMRVL